MEVYQETLQLRVVYNHWVLFIDFYIFKFAEEFVCFFAYFVFLDMELKLEFIRNDYLILRQAFFTSVVKTKVAEILLFK